MINKCFIPQSTLSLAVIYSNLTVGNRNFVTEVTSVETLYDWGLSMRIKNLCRTTKFVQLIGCQIDFFKMPKKLFST